MDANKLERAEELLGHRFERPELLVTALTHPSYAQEHRAEHYQRLEFLGDAVLELVSSAWLYDQYKSATEGELTRMRASRVCEESLCRAAQSLLKSLKSWPKKWKKKPVMTVCAPRT